MVGDLFCLQFIVYYFRQWPSLRHLPTYMSSCSLPSEAGTQQQLRSGQNIGRPFTRSHPVQTKCFAGTGQSCKTNFISCHLLTSMPCYFSRRTSRQRTTTITSVTHFMSLLVSGLQYIWPTRSRTPHPLKFGLFHRLNPSRRPTPPTLHPNPLLRTTRTTFMPPV